MKLFNAFLAASLMLCAMPAYSAVNVKYTKVVKASKDAAKQPEAPAYKIVKSLEPDRRIAIYDIDVNVDPTDTAKPARITGVVSDAKYLAAIEEALDAAGLSDTLDVTILPDNYYMTPRISVACLRHEPSHAAEMDSQVLMGMPLRVFDYDDDGWYRVQCPDGYIGYVTASSLVPLDIDKWKTECRYVVTAPYQVRAYATPTTSEPRDVVTDLVLGCIIVADPDNADTDGRFPVTLPDGRKGYVDSRALTPIRDWADQAFNADLILDTAYSMEGQPYLWGGTSTKSVDCSGLAKTSYLANGYILMRDASQQALTGKKIRPENWRDCRAGDLLFFGTKSGKVTHVAIYDADGNYVHCSGRVKRNSVDPRAKSYLTTPFLSASRIDGQEGTPGITRAIDHPWYF